MIDAALFASQSRERVFIIAIDNAVAVPADIVTTPTAPFHPPTSRSGARQLAAGAGV